MDLLPFGNLSNQDLCMWMCVCVVLVKFSITNTGGSEV